MSLAFLLVNQAQAQIEEVNPNIKWKYIRSQDLDFSAGSVYQFEFPAEKGFDYMFNLSHNLNGITAQMYVYDMQYKPVAKISDSTSNIASDLHFNVESNGTFIIVLRITGDKIENQVVPTKLTLIRRETL
ncbi:hypothetical protein GYB22_00700 [bacterium]|nr:hypothetical protein [bacterium]